MIFHTVWKESQFRVFPCPYFPAFGLKMDTYSINLCTFSPDAEKYKPPKTPNSATFHAMRTYNIFSSKSPDSNKHLTISISDQKSVALSPTMRCFLEI